ncbi:MAG TPA: BlaI/MecI/CopY family transcriptional regulator [Phenylobacterium sp.]|jgi:predicted transcriptional regulator|uniref:BlaI/MecI/CopY family transcriptional regulator n=1 Tax=Phenylobacterium sp. TaxID=1871053 RepID=UPI002D255BF8|nr:BlaI/MecI/CopY family transcriptional regulator [Phenylobacterium sp.]HZZ70019.1 BlaI/MecI/CopY family transcriptional regulator [Phenylobacterium sp.]
MNQDESSARPTATELDILRILWERGPSTVREVHEALSAERPIGYTGVLKFLQIMAGKGSVVRNEDQRAHVYQAAEPPETTKRRAAGDLMRKVFAGSASQLVLHALQDKRASAEDIAEIRRMLDAYEDRQRDPK